MSIVVTASEVQKNFGLWHDRAQKEPVQITKHGRESAYLVSAETYNELWACYRRTVGVRDLSEAEMAMIRDAEIPEAHAYEIEDLSDSDTNASPAPRT
ncbi:type II toxin-antitoxin system Phd/YefM family antitoxin [Methylobacterium durans]|uniref:type II toxin-antitoxin system Phd/YefM family antitoxin n=1 Tax=Methylobacterium durans TaxID=2202825 RepID=UPI002AFDE221|nr:type II toxin-antitoxin system Phd/YefM family antitoxin [Methylobacterium durans]MEA1831212.1 type II toxin-antitoxin system Phd/YefM family antitoxin [Methylobacterium durans]